MSGVVRGRVWRGRGRVDGYWMFEVRRNSRLEEFDRCATFDEAVHRCTYDVRQLRADMLRLTAGGRAELKRLGMLE